MQEATIIEAKKLGKTPSFEEAKEKAKITIKEDNDLTSVWEKDEKYYVVLSRDREVAFRNGYKEIVKYYALTENIKKDAD